VVVLFAGARVWRSLRVLDEVARGQVGPGSALDCGDTRTSTDGALLRPPYPFEEKGRSLMAAGTVKWFNEASGYGFIVPDGGGKDLYVRGGNIVGAGGARLSAGERVEFESRVAGMGPEAIAVLRLAAEPTLVGGQGAGR
jgi:CspA family cold shock protein